MDNTDEVLEEVATELVNEGDFEGELFLSTDGKHTVHVKASSVQTRKEALKWAKAVYETVKERYGTKQQANVEAYNKEKDLGNCSHCNAPNALSKQGKPYCSAKCWLPKQV